MREERLDRTGNEAFTGDMLWNGWRDSGKQLGRKGRVTGPGRLSPRRVAYFRRSRHAVRGVPSSCQTRRNLSRSKGFVKVKSALKWRPRLSLRSRAAIMSASPRSSRLSTSAARISSWASDTDISLLIFFRRSPIYLMPAVSSVSERRRCGPQSAYSVMICCESEVRFLP